MKIITIGRSQNNNVVIDDRFVSRQHAELIINYNGEVIIKDKDSSNGTFVNGVKIAATILKHGDVVHCGSAILNWQQLVQSEVSESQGHRPNIQASRLFIPRGIIADQSRMITLVVASVILIAFFLPWIDFFFSASAWDIIFGDVSDYIETPTKFIFLLIPVSAILIVHGAINNGIYLLPGRMLFLTPVIVISLAMLAGITEYKDELGSNINDIIEVFAYGFWLSLAASIVLVFLPITNKSNTKPQVVVNLWLLLVVVGIISMVVSGNERYFTKTIKVRVDPGIYGVPDAFNIMGQVYDTRQVVDRDKKNMFLYGGILCALAGSILYLRSKSRYS